MFLEIKEQIYETTFYEKFFLKFEKVFPKSLRGVDKGNKKRKRIRDGRDTKRRVRNKKNARKVQMQMQVKKQ